MVRTLAVPLACRLGLAPRPRPPPRSRFRCPRRILPLQPRRDRFWPGPPLAPRRPLLAVAFGFRLDSGLGGVGLRLGVFHRLAEWLLPARLGDHIGHRDRDQRDRANRIVIAWNRNRDDVRIG